MSNTRTPIHTHQLAVRWRDLDTFNHVNNANYLTYIEEARLHWLHTLASDWESLPSAPVMAASQLNYRVPINWPADVRIAMFVERIGNSSLTVGHRIESPDGKVLHCDGHVVLVWIDRQSGKPVPLPESVRAACRAD